MQIYYYAFSVFPLFTTTGRSYGIIEYYLEYICIMTYINGAYNEEAQGWISETILVDHAINLYSELEGNGYVVILQHVGNEWVKTHVTPYTSNFEFRLDKFMEAIEVKIACPEQPNVIQYESI